LDADDASSVEGNDDWGENDMMDLEFQHDHYIYSTRDGLIPRVKQYKYLGITVDTRLGDPRRIVPGCLSMEGEFASSQAKKGLNVLHALRPILTDRFCPIVLKVAFVRNLVYGKMLYGAELVGFQQTHVEPMQRVINTAAKWILGIHKNTSLTDAFTLCYELGLPPIHQEVCAMRARLSLKLHAHTEGGMKTWLQPLWDNPPIGTGSKQTWITLSKKWLAKIDAEAHKFARVLIEDGEALRLEYRRDQIAPLRPWVQLGKSFELRVRSNKYRSDMQDGLRAAFLGTRETGEPPIDTELAPLIRPIAGRLDAPWEYIQEREDMDVGRNVPPGRIRW
jgi:hypothetical protein